MKDIKARSNYWLTTIKNPPHYLPISIILLLAGGLYLWQLGQESLWIDELISLERARNLNLYVPRIFYFVILKFWMIWGNSDAWLRGLGVLFALGSVFFTYQLGCRLQGKTTALVAALLLAMSPLFIHHAQEIRMYTASTFLSVAGTLLFTYVLENPRNRLIFGWAILRWLAIITTPLNALMIAPDLVLFLWKYRHKKSAWLALGKGLLIIAILWLPNFLPLVLKSVPQFMGGVKVPGTAVPTKGGYQSPNLLSFVTQLGRFSAWPFGRANSEAIYQFYNCFSAILTALFGIALFKIRKSQQLIWLTVWALLPLVIIGLIAQVSRSLWVDRYLLFVAPYIFLLVAVGWQQVWQRWRFWAIFVAIIYAIAVSGGIKRYYSVADRADWRGLVTAIVQQEQPQDVIVWSTGQAMTAALNHYYHGSAKIWSELPGPCSINSTKEDMTQWIQNLPTDTSRMWLICTLSEENFPTFKQVIGEELELTNNQVFKGEQIGTVRTLNLFLGVAFESKEEVSSN